MFRPAAIAIILALAGLSGSRASSQTPPGGVYFTIAPCRLIDTRNTSRMTNGTPLTVQATGQCGIPAGASAIAFDPVAINPSGDGFFQFYPGATPPISSAINFKTGKNRASSAIVQLDAAGALTARAIVAGGGSVDLVMDVFGYSFVPPMAVDDTYSTPKDTVLNEPAPGVLSNDTGNQNQAVPFSGPTAHGTVALLADGSFTYTPAAGYLGPDSFPYTVQNPAGSANATASISVTCAGVSVGPATLPGGIVGTPYSQSVVASGGSAPYLYTVATGALPTNLSLDGASGLISGTPTTPGTFNFSVMAADSQGCFGTSPTYSVQICAAIAVSPASLPDATINVPYPTQTVSGSGGTGPYTFTVSAGALPSGLSLDQTTGDITGTADTLGSSTFTIRATSGDGCFGERQYTVRTCVAQNLTPPPGALADAALGSPYSSSVTASGGAGPYSYAITSGVLPPPLAINPGTGAITGTPNTLGNFSFTVTATDGATGCSIGGGYSIRVCSTITLTAPPLPGGTVGTPYSQSVVASGGAGPYTYTVTAGSLPTNLNLDANTGAITGTPTAANTFGFTITATDANGCTGSQAYSIKICPVITVHPPASVCATVGGAYNQTVTATGGTGPYTFAVTSGSLPPTLGLASSGALSGTTTTAGNFAFTVTATDANGCTGSLAITIPVLSSLSPAGPALPDTTYGSAYNQSITASGGSGLTYSVTAGSLPGWLSLNPSTGALTGTASGADGAGNYSFTITATDPGSGCSTSRPYTFTSRPVVVADSLAFGVGNTEYYSGGFSPTPSTPFVSTATNILTNDLAPAGFTTATIVTQPSNGTVTLNSNGSFRFTPAAGAGSAVSFTYKITANGVDSASTATVTIPLTTRVWYINAAVANGIGTSNSPFNALHNAEAPSAPGEYIFIHSGGTLPPSDGIALQANQVLWGQGTTLDVGNLTIPATSKPTLTGTVTLNSGVTVSSLDIATNPGSQTGINDPAGAINGVTIKNGVTVATTTGVAVLLSDVDSTAGGAPNFGINLVSVSANGAANGISLTNVNTASGSFTVSGNSGGFCGGLVTVFSPGTPNGVTAPNTADCTGGTIQATTGAGVLLANAANVSLTRMYIHDSGSDEINATALNGFTLDHSYVTDASGGAGDRGIEIGDFTTGTAVNGTINITNSTIGPTPHDNVGIGIGSGTSTWNVTGTVFDGSQLDSGFNFEIRNATVTSFNMNSCVARNQFADGVQIQPAAGVNATITSATIQSTTFQGNNLGLDLNQDGTSNVTYKVLSNTILNQAAESIRFFSSAAATGGTLNGRFVGNVIGNAGSFNSGGGAGIRINVNGGTDATVLVDGNTIRQVPNGRGIEIISRNGTGGTDATVTNNFVNTDFTPTVQNGGLSLSNIFLQSNCVSVCNTLRSDVRGNTVPAVAPTGELVNFQLVLIQSGASTNQLVDNAPASPDAASELASHNTGNTGVGGTVTLIPGPINTPP
jgi:hypothetical protein